MIRIVADSSCDLPPEIVAELGVTVVPLTIRFGTDEFVDGTEMGTDAFWDRLIDGNGLPETAAPSAGAFLDAYQALFAGGATGIAVLTLSSDLSATHQAAAIAAEKVDGTVRVLDSRSVSMGVGLQVIAATEHAATGADIDEVVTAALRRVDGVTLLAALDTIEFLKRGGRIGGASALVAGLLDIKPIITMTNGVIDAVGRVRTRSKATERIVTECVNRGDTGRLAVFGGRTIGFDQIVERIRAETVIPVVATELGAVVGTHSGPGVLGMAHLRD